jgi:FkbM family methyltransferase
VRSWPVIAPLLSRFSWEYLTKPEYLFRPHQIARRAWHALAQPPALANVRLPWGLTITCRPNDELGYSLWTTGVYDLAVTEALWRLTEPGETAVDVGANIGYMTSVLASRVGTKGTVYAFEPHPEIHQELLENLGRWRSTMRSGEIRASPLALSSACGTAMLWCDDYFTVNRGTASLIMRSPASSGTTVDVGTLDTCLRDERRIGVLKLDVEGAELSVLLGAGDLLRRHAIRDIVFEGHEQYRRPVFTLLAEAGYAIFRLSKGHTRPLLSEPGATERVPRWGAPSYLATLDAERSRRLFSARGWKCLSG